MRENKSLMSVSNTLSNAQYAENSIWCLLEFSSTNGQ